MKIVASLFVALLIGVSAQSAFAIDGETEIQRIEHELNASLILPKEEQLAVVQKFSAEILALVAQNEISANRAEFALAFIDRVV